MSNRIGEIQTLTEAAEWRFVPGRLNPADAATRSAFGDEVLPSVWLTSPAFLHDPEDNWPRDLPWMAVTEEIKPVRDHYTRMNGPTFDWDKLIISQEDIPALSKLEEPFFQLVKRCQSEAYPEEIRLLGKDFNKSSSLLTLAPFLGDDGLLRVGNRARRAKLPYERLHPQGIEARWYGAAVFLRPALLLDYWRPRSNEEDTS